MMEPELSTPTAEELAQWLRQLCPGREADFVTALRWLYDHPKEAAFLCGFGEAAPRRKLLLSIQSGDARHTWPWRPGAWWGKVKIASEKTREKQMKTRENKSSKNIDEKTFEKVLTPEKPCAIIGKLPNAGASFCSVYTGNI